jgi:hypothetical protein
MYIISALGLHGLFSSRAPMEQHVYPPVETTFMDDWAMMLILYAVKPPAECVSVCAYCQQNHDQILQWHEVSHKALLLIGSQITPHKLFLWHIFVDCRLMTRKSVLFIPNTTVIGLLHFFTFVRFVPLIRSTSLFTRFLLGISSHGFMSPRRLNCRPARGLHLKTMWPTDFQIITPSGSVLKSIIYRWKEKGRPVRLPPWW